ncbi:MULTISPECIES: hypothetical protein [Paenibacillus]|uniref:hypothetical protein n=1 Tax=Paenibacillus TaxID=44249 RepID=UPI001059A7DA|nr:MULTISPECIES: hypothetical protein [Paenibacillus]TDL67676.1 hypothetical protein E2R58_00170 [Paenibacillus amylolyticus]
MALTSANIISTLRTWWLLGPREAIGRGGDSADTSAPTNRIAAAPVGRLSRWDVVDTVTL